MNDYDNDDYQDKSINKKSPLKECRDAYDELNLSSTNLYIQLGYEREDNKRLRADLTAAQKRIAELEGNNISIGKWLSAALEDSKVCKEMKEDINNWFSAFEPKKEDKT